MCVTISTDRRQDLRLRDEAVRQLVVVVSGGGDDLRPCDLVPSELLVGLSCRHLPAEDGRHVSRPHLEGGGEVGCLQEDSVRGRCWRRKTRGLVRLFLRLSMAI